MSDFQIRLSGSGGQGLQLAAKILASALLVEGKRVAQSQSYEPTSRGGLSRSDLVIGKLAVDYPLVTDLDCLLILDQVAVSGSLDIIRPSTVVLMDSERVTEAPEIDCRPISLALVQTARDIGNVRTANIIALSVLAELCGFCEAATLRQVVEERMPPRFVSLNLDALGAGIELAHGVELFKPKEMQQ